MTKVESLRQAQLALLRGELRADVGAAGRGIDRRTVPFPARNQPVVRRNPPSQWAGLRTRRRLAGLTRLIAVSTR